MCLRAEAASPAPPPPVTYTPTTHSEPAGVDDGSLRALLGRHRLAQDGVPERVGWEGGASQVEAPRRGGAGWEVSGPLPGSKGLEGFSSARPELCPRGARWSGGSTGWGIRPAS